MPYLALDTSTEHLSLALALPSGIVGRDWLVGQKHAELTLPRLAEFLAEHQLDLAQIEGIAFGCGPGSFTGLRIGCGLVQGLALGRNLPVVGISTLEALAERSGAQRVIACLDARMNQIYTARYVREAAGWQEDSPAQVCDPQSLAVPESGDWFGIGSGFTAYGETLRARLGACLRGCASEAFPRATEILALALPRFATGEVVPAEAATLLYLRDKVAQTTAERTRA